MCVCGREEGGERCERRSCTQKPSRSQEIMVMSKVDTFEGVHHLTEQTLSPTSPIFGLGEQKRRCSAQGGLFISPPEEKRTLRRSD